MDYLYSLYDALVSINVPNDKARAVVDAMERDMGTTIATKTDLQTMSAATKSDFQALSAATKADFQALRAETKADLQAHRAETKADLQAFSTAMKAELQVFSAATKAELQQMRAEMATKSELAELWKECALIRKDMEMLFGRQTIQLGVMLVVGLGVMTTVLGLVLN
jgi:isopropylmalate/homocitrate/citramalate synthase